MPSAEISRLNFLMRCRGMLEESNKFQLADWQTVMTSQQKEMQLAYRRHLRSLLVPGAVLPDPLEFPITPPDPLTP